MMSRLRAEDFGFNSSRLGFAGQKMSVKRGNSPEGDDLCQDRPEVYRIADTPGHLA
jgi:hypothetical protein